MLCNRASVTHKTALCNVKFHANTAPRLALMGNEALWVSEKLGRGGKPCSSCSPPPSVLPPADVLSSAASGMLQLKSCLLQGHSDTICLFLMPFLAADIVPKSNCHHGVNWCLKYPPGTAKGQPNSGPVVLADDLKNPAMEKLELVRKWSINTYKVSEDLSLMNFVWVAVLIIVLLVLLQQP